MREAATICPALCKLTFDVLTLKLVSESHVTWAISANFSLPRPLCYRLGPMYATDRQTSDVRQPDEHHRLMPGNGGIKTRNEKNARRRKHCALAVVRRGQVLTWLYCSKGQKISPRRRPPSGARDGQNLIRWRWSLPSPTDPVW